MLAYADSARTAVGLGAQEADLNEAPRTERWYLGIITVLLTQID